MSFDKDYFENGLQTGQSAYENYRWMPELTIPLAHELIIRLDLNRNDRILDFGCAKGYLIKAFRLLHYKAWGVDISHYAIKHAPEDIKKYLWEAGELPLYEFERVLRHHDFQWVISKDVFEHIHLNYLLVLLDSLQRFVPHMFVVVPLGKDGQFNAPTNNLDPSHIICEDMQWWTNLFTNSGFFISASYTQMAYIKKAYNHIEDAHGFFILNSLCQQKKDI